MAFPSELKLSEKFSLSELISYRQKLVKATFLKMFLTMVTFLISRLLNFIDVEYAYVLC